MQSLSLYELNSLVRKNLERVMPDEYWVRAEVARVNESRGHCYLELVQKSEHGNDIVAKTNGTVWANRWSMLRAHFQSTTGQRLSAGMQVLVQAKATFHEMYGYSLNISDIDPTFTLGDIAKRRQEIIRQLTDEGVIDMNKELPLPRLLQRIAVISSATAAGYGDFCDQLHGNKHGLAFHTELFQATMQGNDVENSIISALNRIAQHIEQWDAVVIIRGGGAVTDLAGFDTLTLAENVAQFPLPVITGIGHERDDTVIDLVAHTRVKTPTAAAELLIQHQYQQLVELENIADCITTATSRILQREDSRIKGLTAAVPMLFARVKASQDVHLAGAVTTMQQSTRRYFERLRHNLEVVDLHIDAASPEHVLQLGYSIARVNGKAVRDAATLMQGDVIETTFAHGTTLSVVKDVK